ncbi:hypothetical protein Tco_1241721, partial [Tanacetum coccineum]
DSICSGSGGIDGGNDGESGLDLLRDKYGNSDESSGNQVDDSAALHRFMAAVVDEQLMSKQSGYGVTQSHSDPHLVEISLSELDMMINGVNTPARGAVVENKYGMRCGHGAMTI